MPQPQKSPGLTKAEEIKGRIAKVYTPEEAESYAFYIRRLELAKQQREQPYKFFDDQTYIQDYISNENAKNTYLRPKLNDAEVRVNTGTTEKKIEAVYNELLAMNLQHEVRAYDQDDLEVAELGDDVSDIVTRTNQIEKDEDFWQEATLELLTQRAVFIEENFVVRHGGAQGTVARAEKRLISGLKVFPGDITIPAYLWDQQPYVVIYNRLNQSQAEALFSNNPNWKHAINSAAKRNEYLGGAHAYRMANTQEGDYEHLIYYSVQDNECINMLNGVLMDAPGTKIPESHGRYRIRCFVLKSMSTEFLYGRPLTASAKTLQALDNESIRLMIRKFQQSLEPPMGVPKGKVYSRDIWDPGAVAQGVTKDMFQKLIDHNGPTESEFRMMEFIEDKVKEFIGAGNLLQGLPEGSEISATQVLTMQKQAIKMLGLAVLALNRMKRDLTEMRIITILDNYLEPIRMKYDPQKNKLQNVYRSFTIKDAAISNNARGDKIILLRDEDLTPEETENVYQYEEKYKVRIKNINRQKLKAQIPFLSWYVIVTPQEKEGSALDKVMFQDQFTQGVAIQKVTGVPLNNSRVIEDYERKWKAKDWFQRRAPNQLQGQPNPEQDKVKTEAEKMMGDIDKMAEGGMSAQVNRGLRGAPASAVRETMGAEMM